MAPAAAPGRRRTLVPDDGPIDVALTLAPLCHGRGDPTMRVLPGDVRRATRTPEGPAAARLRTVGGTVEVEAWGPGADWVLAAAPDLVGGRDRAADFDPRVPLLRDLARRFAGLRIPRSGAVVEALVPTILEQKVVGAEARAAYRALVRRLAEPAPGPLGLLLPPAPAALAAAPSWVFHRAGVERMRADTVRRAALSARRLEEAVAMPLPDAYRRLTALPGVGPWSAAHVAMVALGDADAVALGDYHLPNAVCWALAGEARGDDARMLELLEPFRPHRGRVLRLLGAAAIHAPRRGPRMPLRGVAPQ